MGLIDAKIHTENATDVLGVFSVRSDTVKEMVMSNDWEVLELPAELASALAGLLASAREAGARIERECNGGATATYFNGKLIICHPDMPPHMWDGAKMERLLPAAPQGER